MYVRTKLARGNRAIDSTIALTQKESNRWPILAQGLDITIRLDSLDISRIDLAILRGQSSKPHPRSNPHPQCSMMYPKVITK